MTIPSILAQKTPMLWVIDELPSFSRCLPDLAVIPLLSGYQSFSIFFHHGSLRNFYEDKGVTVSPRPLWRSVALP